MAVWADIAGQSCFIQNAVRLWHEKTALRRGIVTGMNEFFREIRKKRKDYRRGYTNIRTRRRIREDALQKAKEEQNPIIKYLWLELARWQSI